MAKSKSKSVNETQISTDKTQTVFVPINKKYKPIPKFNGKCPNC